MWFLKNKLFEDPFEVKEEETTEIKNNDKSLDLQPPATRKELWSYYFYYNGVNFLPTLLQYMAQKGGFDPNSPDKAPCNLDLSINSDCNVSWLNSSIPVVSLMMYATAISFGTQFVLFTTFGSLADYGRFNRYILIIATLVSCTAQILPIIFLNNDGSGWGGMVALYVIALVSYGASLVFYAAAFPTLSDNLPIVRKARNDPTVTVEETQDIIEKWRSTVSAISTTFSNIGFLVLTAVFSGVAFIPWSEGPFLNDEHTFGNTPLYYYIASLVCGAFWLVNAIPYFLFQPSGRRGPPLPQGEHYLTIGWKSIYQALKEARKYRYLFLYILSYFMFGDGVNATSNLQNYIQNNITSFSATQTAVMGLITAITSIFGCLFFLFLSRQYKISTKANLMIIVITSGIVPIWGCFGIGLDNFGIKTKWELWVLAFWSGFFTGPIWAWQQTLLSELVPRGKENLFFGLFGIVNKASSWIGATIIGGVTQSTNNAYYGWPVIAAMFVIATILLAMIDVDKARLEMMHMDFKQELDQSMSHNREHITSLELSTDESNTSNTDKKTA